MQHSNNERPLKLKLVRQPDEILLTLGVRDGANHVEWAKLRLEELMTVRGKMRLARANPAIRLLPVLRIDLLKRPEETLQIAGSRE